MNKNERINLRTTEKERQLLETMADREGLKPSEMLRLLIRNGAEERGLLPTPELSPGDMIIQVAQEAGELIRYFKVDHEQP